MHQGSNAVGKGSGSEFGHGHPASTTTLPLGGAEGVDPQPRGSWCARAARETDEWRAPAAARNPRTGRASSRHDTLTKVRASRCLL